MQTAFGLPAVMMLFVVFSVMAFVFTKKFLPETKGLSVEEVVAEFERESDTSQLQKA
jgi:hypothetical protein